MKGRSLIVGLSMVWLLVSFTFAQVNEKTGLPYDKQYRVDYAKGMGMKAEGKDSTTLKVKNKINQNMIRYSSNDNSPMILAWRDFGFKKVIFIDGTRTWTKILSK